MRANIEGFMYKRKNDKKQVPKYSQVAMSDMQRKKNCITK